MFDSPNPNIDVPASTSVKSPLKHDEAFPSYRGRSAFDANDAEFDLNRKYTIGTGTETRSPPATNAEQQTARQPNQIDRPSNTELKASSLRSKVHFPSFRGRSMWDADEDEFGHGRKYSIETEEEAPSRSHYVDQSMLQVQHHSPDKQASSRPDPTTKDVSKLLLSLKIRHKEISNSYRGRTPLNVDGYEANHASLATVTKEEVSQPPTPLLSPSSIRSPRLSSPYPLPQPSPGTEPEEAVSSKLRGGDDFPASQGRSPFDPDDDEFNFNRRYTIATLSSRSLTSALMTKSKPKRSGKISWIDQLAKTNPALSHDTREQTELGSKHGDGEVAVTSTLTSNTSSPKLPTQLQSLHLNPYKTIRRSEDKLMSATLSAAREISPFKGNIWDPEDDEWAEMDANKVVETFKATYKSPVPQTPTKTGAMSYFGTAIQQTVKSVLSSPKKRAEEQMLREEERIRDQVEELRNSWCCDPEGDANDEVMKNVFLGPNHSFPYQRLDSPRSMHIVDLEAYFGGEDPIVKHAYPRLCDSVATVLSHTSKECLEAFLNPAVEEFVYRRELDRNKGGLILMIRRSGNEVHCGAYVTFGFMKQWKLYVKSLISITGQWHEVYATTKPGIMPIENGLVEWGTIKSDLGMVPKEETSPGAVPEPRKLELSPSKKKAAVILDVVNETNPKFMLYQARFLARWFLWDMWFYFDKRYDCKAIWEADGKPAEVRLRRDLVGGEDEKDK